MRTLQQHDIRQQPAARGRVGWSATMGVAGLTVAVALGLRLLALALGIDIRVSAGGTGHGVGLVAVGLASGVSALCGALTLRLALRLFARGRRWWTIVAVLVLAVSLLNPLQATTVSAWLVLSLLHLVTAAVVVLGLRRASA